MAEEKLADLIKAISESMDRILVNTHDAINGECPQCRVPAPCKVWMDAKEALVKGK